MPLPPVNPAIVSDLYKVALTPDQWPDLLDKLHPVVNAKCAGLAIIENVSYAGDTAHQFACTSNSINTKEMETYNREFAQYEQAYAAKIFSSTPGTPVIDEAFENREQIVKRSDVEFCINNMGILDRFAVRLNDDQAWVDCIAFQYSPDRLNVTSEEFSKLTPYLPHIAQAVKLGRIYNAIRQRYQAVLSVLNKINIGIIIIREDSTVVVCNDWASELIQNSPHLSVTENQTLKASKTNTQNELQSSVQVIAQTAKGQNHSSHSYVKVGDDETGDNLLIELTPLIDAQSEIESGFHGVLALLIDPNRSYPIQANVLTSLYALTPAENSVASLISEGKSYDTVAESRNVSRETVKAQVSSIYGKMKIDSRAGFFRRLMSITLPFSD